MPHPFFVSPDRVALVANDNHRALRSTTEIHHVPPQVTVKARTTGAAELVFYVEDGLMEFMVAGAAGFVGPGAMVRVPPRTAYAYRNVGDDIARLVSNRVGTGTMRPRLTVTVAFDAA